MMGYKVRHDIGYFWWAARKENGERKIKVCIFSLETSGKELFLQNNMLNKCSLVVMMFSPLWTGGRIGPEYPLLVVKGDCKGLTS